MVNRLLKAEDSVTFYDYDQQAFLLAEDLEKTLPKVYAESCRYYLVFIDPCYIEKVWTRFERAIMTRAGRSRHIIPVLLDKNSFGRVVGISSTIVMIDLTEEWSQISVTSSDKRSIEEKIKAKLVTQLIEKVSASAQTAIL